MSRRAVRAGMLGAAALFGVATGLGAYTFVYARGYSYLTDDPAACANCHVMDPQYDGWLNSAHHEVATCNDCHTPASFLPKYGVKALNGFNHAWSFTTGNFEEPIQATRLNKRVAQQACMKCHETLVHPLKWTGRTGNDETWQLPECTHCHGSIGHPF
jgi:cytochrome c nitrite reductase small subunit